MHFKVHEDLYNYTPSEMKSEQQYFSLPFSSITFIQQWEILDSSSMVQIDWSRKNSSSFQRVQGKYLFFQKFSRALKKYFKFNANSFKNDQSSRYFIYIGPKEYI